MKTQQNVTEYIDNRIKKIAAGRQFRFLSSGERKLIQKYDIIRNAILGNHDAHEWCESQLDPDNNEPGSTMYNAAQDVLNYLNS